MAKELPLRTSKGKVKLLYPNYNRNMIKDDINYIIKRNRKRPYSKQSEKEPQNNLLEHLEWLILLDWYGIPAGYSNMFIDGETLQQKLEYQLKVKEFR